MKTAQLLGHDAQQGCRVPSKQMQKPVHFLRADLAKLQDCQP